MQESIPELPRLRTAIEPIPLMEGDERRVALRDPSGLAEGMVALSLPAFMLVQMFDGTNRLVDIQAGFARMTGQLLFSEELTTLIQQLDDAGFLDTPRFQVRYEAAIDEYRTSGVRRMRALEAMATNGRPLTAEIDAILEDGAAQPDAPRLVGLIAPHLDWPRGRPCYARAYAALRNDCRARRFVVLGTNHFGRSVSVVATGNDFETPLGRIPVDRLFLKHLEGRVGRSLRADEFDHRAEHSIELQLPFLQRIVGGEPFTLVPFLCPDPCGPTGTAPRAGEGVDLRDFSVALRETIRDDDTETIVIAGADLSHIGQQFGDSEPLTPEWLEQVSMADLAALRCLDDSGPEAFRSHLAETGNPTRICSAGCIYAAAVALEGARPERLHYHQAADESTQTCVTGTAYAFRVAS